MGKKNFSEEQIAFALRQAESGASVAEVILNLVDQRGAEVGPQRHRGLPVCKRAGLRVIQKKFEHRSGGSRTA